MVFLKTVKCLLLRYLISNLLLIFKQILNYDIHIILNFVAPSKLKLWKSLFNLSFKYMKNIKVYAFIFSVIVFGILCFTACDNSDNSFTSTPPLETNQTSKIAVRLIDAPGDYDEVNLEVIDVLIKRDQSDEDSGWVSIGASKVPVQYNMMELTGGVNALIADTLVPSGYLGQIRLLLGENNTVVKDGVSHPLKTPSGQQSGVKLMVNQTLEPGISYDFTMDFNVDKSVIKAGNSGNYNLHPVVRVFTTVSLGSIRGTVTPLGFQVKASVMVDDIEISAYTDDTGAFQISGVPAGTYTVMLIPDPLAGYIEATVPNIAVTDGLTTNIGSVVLLPVPVPAPVVN